MQAPWQRPTAGLARSVDDPAAPDTGVGVGPIIDQGAYERQGPEDRRADFNDDGFVNSQDFFDFLTEFFSGCP